MTPALPDPLPPAPGPLIQQWLDEARQRSRQANWNAMTLATADAEGRPAARTVLLKEFEAATSTVTFYTNYQSRKAREIEANPHVALVMHWDAMERQMRVEGRAEPAPAEVSDRYFASRPRLSQIGAWASEQSRPLASWQSLLGRVTLLTMKYAGREVPRPPHWGGYLVRPDAVEFWVGGANRIHRRLRYERDGETWSHGWLFP